MEVILREHVDNLGSRGDVVKVASGYARNYLLPKKLALPVTEASKRQIEREREKAEARDAEERAAAEALSQRVSGFDISIARRVGENNTMYGSVTSADVAQALAAKGFDPLLVEFPHERGPRRARGRSSAPRRPTTSGCVRTGWSARRSRRRVASVSRSCFRRAAKAGVFARAARIPRAVNVRPALLTQVCSYRPQTP